MKFRILGPLEVIEAGRTVELSKGQPEILLGVLLLYAGEVVSTERLVDELWGERPPKSAAKSVQRGVWSLRRSLGSDTIVTRAGGYSVAIEDHDFDAARFERLASEGHAALPRDPARASELLREALALWRGSPLEGLRLESQARNEVRRLAEQRAAAQEQLFEARLALGSHGQIISELQKLVAGDPYRETLRAHLMLALYRSGRQSEALSCYQEGRRLLADELGLEPSRALRELEGKILAQADELLLSAAPSSMPMRPAATSQPVASERAAAPPAAAPAPPRDTDARRVVTVLAAAASLPDPEARHNVLDRCARVISAHGGAVERYIGDTIAGLFGLTASREDDALRAIRAAIELSELDAGSLRLGIESGEVFVRTGPRDTAVATGETFVVAGRLVDAAAVGEILLGERVRDALGPRVRVDDVRGRLLGVEPEPPPLLGMTGPFVGRRAELAQLRATFASVRDEHACHVLTVVGQPGIGKSRLAREFVADLGEEAIVLVGRCAPHGEATPFAALAELQGQLGEDPRADVSELLRDDPQAARGALAALGLVDAPVQLEQSFWGMHRLLARLARERPLVIVIEDIHWAEAALLDLLDHVAALSARSPILLLCLARPELGETRAAWIVPRVGRSIVPLDVLAKDEVRELVERLGAGERAAHIAQAAEGNPLFAEQLVAVDAQHADDEILPASIHAVLAARLDGLHARERTLLQYAAVEGRTFHTGALAALLHEEGLPSIGAALVALTHKGLIRADRPRVADQDAFRFDHALIREAAYRSLPKRLRAELHERVADWLEARPDGSRDEIIGHHLEQACRIPTELGWAGARERELAARAARRLQRAAQTALARGDPRSASALLERGAALLERDSSTRLALLPALGRALLESGRLADADPVLAEAVEQSDDPVLAARARIEYEFVQLFKANQQRPSDAVRRMADAGLAVFAVHADEAGECRARCLQATISWVQGKICAADDAWQRAARLAERIGDERELYEILGWRASAAAVGPTPVDQALRRCNEILARVDGHPVAVAVALHPLAMLHAMSASFDTARRLVHEADETLRDLGRMQSAVSHHAAFVELLAGRPDAAEACLIEGYDQLTAMGEGSLLPTTAAMLAHAVYEQGRLDEAERLAAVVERTSPADDIVNHVLWRTVRGKVLARRGEVERSERLADAAVALIEQTDLLTHHANALLDLSDVYRLSGRTDNADSTIGRALLLYERKGNIVSARRARSRLPTTKAD